MNRFAVVGSRVDGRSLLIDIAYKDTPRESRALDALLTAVRGDLGVRGQRLRADDAQRYAFATLLAQMLRFSDENNFASTLTEKDRYRKLRLLATSVNGQFDDILHTYRHRTVVTFSFNKPDDPAALLKRIRKVLP